MFIYLIDYEQELIMIFFMINNNFETRSYFNHQRKSFTKINGNHKNIIIR